MSLTLPALTASSSSSPSSTSVGGQPFTITGNASSHHHQAFETGTTTIYLPVLNAVSSTMFRILIHEHREGRPRGRPSPPEGSLKSPKKPQKAKSPPLTFGLVHEWIISLPMTTKPVDWTRFVRKALAKSNDSRPIKNLSCYRLSKTWQLLRLLPCWGNLSISLFLKWLHIWRSW